MAQLPGPPPFNSHFDLAIFFGQIVKPHSDVRLWGNNRRRNLRASRPLLTEADIALGVRAIVFFKLAVESLAVPARRHCVAKFAPAERVSLCERRSASLDLICAQRYILPGARIDV